MVRRFNTIFNVTYEAKGACGNTAEIQIARSTCDRCGEVLLENGIERSDSWFYNCVKDTWREDIKEPLIDPYDRTAQNALLPLADPIAWKIKVERVLF